MKKTLFGLVAGALLSVGLTAPALGAESSDNLNFEVVDGKTIKVTGGHNFSADLEIPGTITVAGTSYPVTEIENSAFEDSGITSLTLPDEVETIGRRAFASNAIFEVQLPDSVTDVGQSAFSDNNVHVVGLGNGVRSLGEGSFRNNSITELTIPASVSSLSSFALAGSPMLHRVRFIGNVPPSIGTSVMGLSASPEMRYPVRFTPNYEASNLAFDYPGRLIATAEVTLDAGQADPAVQIVDVGYTVWEPGPPTKTGHTFSGWFNGAERFNFATPVTTDLTLTARFNPIAVAGLAPKISGDPREGKTLTAVTGKVSPRTTKYAYQWRSNSKAIQGATRSTFTPGKAQAGTRLSVTVTARAPHHATASKTSATTARVSSSKRRIHLSATQVAKGKPLTVTATGFKARQKVTITLAGKVRFTGRADARGIISRSVKFASNTKAGKQTVQVTSLKTNGKRDKVVRTSVRYR